MGKLIRAPQITRQDNYVWLLVALLVVFFCAALFEQLGSDTLQRLMGLLLTIIILVSVWSMESGRHPLYSRAGITTVLFVVVGLEYLFEHEGWAILQLTTIMLFTVTTIILSCQQVLLSGSVDGNKIIGAICIYMFLALAWALVYLLVEQFFPGSIPAFEGEDWRADLQEAVYFSFVTMTTLGYGDISPVQPLARYIAYLEAITGQFYIAILVASLIGVKLADRQAEAA